MVTGGLLIRPAAFTRLPSHARRSAFAGCGGPWPSRIGNLTLSRALARWEGAGATPYGHGNPPERSLEGAQHAIARTVLWDLRVLAGWLPRDGVQLLRALAGWFELASIEELPQTMAGRPAGAQFALGALAMAWPRLSQATSPAARLRLAEGSLRPIRRSAGG